jgi:glycosyltransferase involved in cell wall biosynthesis
MASGTPVIGYDTGAIRELVGDQGGCVVPYGADDDRLQPAEPKPLVEATHKVLAQLTEFRRSARQRAEEEFDVRKMVALYIQALQV